MPQEFDILKAPLSGFHLLDASAGTGKTYTLSGLFLRLILEKGLGANEILVVTYTRAATGDLRSRIRERLASCLAAVKGENISSDALVNQLVENISDRKKAEDSLYEALVNFDEAGIFTIHGFCQRILQENSLEIGTAFDLEVEPDMGAIIRGIMLDYWRRTIARVTPGLLIYAGDRLQPDHLIRLTGKMRAGLEILPKIDRQRLKLLLDEGELKEREKDIHEIVEEAGKLWLRDGPRIREILEHCQGLYKSITGKLHDFYAELDLFFSALPTSLHKYPEALEKLAASRLSEKTKKNYEPPGHQFFDICQDLLERRRDLEELYEYLVVSLQVEAFDFVEREQEIRKEKAGVISYDDLLLFLARALENEATAGRGNGRRSLAGIIRTKHKAALIDEFQDTDPLQYRIFSHIYHNSTSTLLYIIGDPKQAIYSFRGADIYSYLEAVRAASSRNSLIYNYRSEPGLIKAVNSVFSRKDYPFLFEEIPFSPVIPAEKEEREILTFNGEYEAPFKIWFATRNGENKPLNKPEAVKAIITALASEICSLLNRSARGEVKIGNRPLKAGDIAILVRKNQEAREVKEGLEIAGVPGVIQAGGDLFQSREAEELEFILQAVSEPFNETAVRSALATDLFPQNVSSLAALADKEEILTQFGLRFQGYHDLWQIKGFMAMFRLLLEREGLRKQALRFFDGERRLTNLLHLGEILEQYARHYQKGISSVLRYLSESRQAGNEENNEERQMRLESDEERVRIVTIHTSKGLQYPIVFCPFSWGIMKPSKREGVLFHRSEDLKPCLDLGSDNLDVNLKRACQESMAEELRILYVALTRAINRCYLVWGPFNTAEKSALAWLFHGPTEGGPANFKIMSDEDILADLQPLVRESGGEIEIGSLPEKKNFLEDGGVGNIELIEPVFTGNITTNFRIASFSSLAGQSSKEREWLPDQGETAEEKELNFPKGAKAGNFFHDLLENLDFDGIAPDDNEDGEEKSLTSLLNRKLRDYGYDPDWEYLVRDILQKTITTPLDGHNLMLKHLKKDFCLKEMEFYFPFTSLSGKLLSDILVSHGDPYGKMAELGFSEMQGYMKGYIDLIFWWDNRYYLLDWKTNYLGAKIQDYQPDKLSSVMVEERYILQYLIYTVALHQFLKLKLDNYSYQDHFGGIFYLFLRGMDPEPGNNCGIYYDLPPESLIQNLTDNIFHDQK